MNNNTLITTKIYNIKTTDGKHWKVQEQQQKLYISALKFDKYYENNKQIIDNYNLTKGGKTYVIYKRAPDLMTRVNGEEHDTAKSKEKLKKLAVPQQALKNKNTLDKYIAN
jgi:hypothetical protein